MTISLFSLLCLSMVLEWWRHGQPMYFKHKGEKEEQGLIKGKSLLKPAASLLVCLMVQAHGRYIGIRYIRFCY